MNLKFWTWFKPKVYKPWITREQFDEVLDKHKMTGTEKEKQDLYDSWMKLVDMIYGKRG